MKKTLLTIAVLALLGMGAVQAQKTTHFSLRLGGNIPTGKFAEASGDYSSGNPLNWGLEDKSKKGGAGLGFMLGGQLKFDIPTVKGLGVIASVDGIYNTLNSDVKGYYDDMEDDLDGTTMEFSVKLPRYINIPIMVGLGYTYSPTHNLGLFAEGAIGLNVRVITNGEQMRYVVATNTETITTSNYNTAATFGVRVGGGIVLNNKFTIGLDYFNLGTAKAEGETVTEINGTEQSNPPKLKAGKITPTMVALRFGINL
ncbi:MAG: outer membrane beta-barrel protein [Bacteroidales bacterium]|nr:outer membrane beta-barrel protein [Bacteroidales bacterium]